MKSLKPHVTDIAVNLWGHDLLQQWNTQDNIPAVSETDNKLTHISGNGIKGSKKKTIQPVKEKKKNNNQPTLRGTNSSTFKMVN